MSSCSESVSRDFYIDFDYSDITCEESNLGKVCNLLSQKRSDVQSETMDEKTMEFRIVALLPSTESSDFSVDLRRVASGKASITFEIEGWQLNPYNPFPESSQTVEVRNFLAHYQPVHTRKKKKKDKLSPPKQKPSMEPVN